MRRNFYRRSGKHNAVRTEYSGVMFASKREAAYAQELDLLQKAGKVRWWVGQKPFIFEAYGAKICKYILDFDVVYTDGHREYIEVKGYATAMFKLKWKMFLAYLKKHEPNVVAKIVK